MIGIQQHIIASSENADSTVRIITRRKVMALLSGVTSKYVTTVNTDRRVWYFPSRTIMEAIVTHGLCVQRENLKIVPDDKWELSVNLHKSKATNGIYQSDNTYLHDTANFGRMERGTVG